MNRTMLATHLGVSKSFVSQLLSGNYNYSLSKLIEISLKLGFQPDFTFKPIHLENSKSRISDTATVNTNQPVINT
ncbi:MAG: helix-turn-helix transcriptional regulator [Paludibacteraceae bacterium]|nr:helix-turn-helix transcriptional regulator [Paludibacteraceae bacterium]